MDDFKWIFVETKGNFTTFRCPRCKAFSVMHNNLAKKEGKSPKEYCPYTRCCWCGKTVKPEVA